MIIFTTGCNQIPAKTPPASVTYLPQTSGNQTEAAATTPHTGLWIDPTLPDMINQTAIDARFPIAESLETAATLLVPTDGPELNLNNRSVQWIYALVGPFSSRVDGVRLDDIHSVWSGNVDTIFSNQSLLVEESAYGALLRKWGESANDQIKSVPADQVLEILSQNNDFNFAIIPFESLQQTWKVLMVDNQSPVHNDFNPSEYPLTFYFSCQGEYCVSMNLPATNRDPGKLTVLVMTGVTAMVRRTAWTMERKGILYPGRDIREWLRNADITHISNEIPFAENCPYPNPDQQEIRFCSSPRYIELLKDLGADIIEMTGNHFQDWGSEATLKTLEIYDQLGWLHYGGGANLMDSRKSIKLTSNGNKIAFIGCNSSGPYYAWATETEAGAAPCGDLGWMVDEIRNLQADDYLPIVTFQYYEYYTPEPRPNQSRDFKLMADAGAILVSGSQAHIPQTMEFYNDTLLLYGMGNLFFDQMNYPLGDTVTTRTRQELIARHVFYDNRLISTELLTAMLEDYSKPRPMTAEERKDLLDYIFLTTGK